MLMIRYGAKAKAKWDAGIPAMLKTMFPGARQAYMQAHIPMTTVQIINNYVCPKRNPTGIPDTYHEGR